MIKFTIAGKCVPKARPRVTRSGHTYTPKKTADYEKLVQTEYRKQVGKEPFAKDVPLKAEITISEKPPKSWSRKKTEQALRGVLVPTKKPDLDNCVKSVLDALNGVAFYDDSQVATLYVSKRYAQYDEVKVIIYAQYTTYSEQQ